LLASLLGREHAIKTRGAETARSRGAGTMHVCMIVATAVVPFPGVATHARSVTVARPCRRGRCPPPPPPNFFTSFFSAFHLETLCTVVCCCCRQLRYVYHPYIYRVVYRVCIAVLCLCQLSCCCEGTALTYRYSRLALR